MSVKHPIHDVILEAQRQVQICNACRYCEGFCSVFPAINRQRQFSDGDITQLANLCHNCQGCFHACQYTAPHEFNINVPQVLANVRVESWHSFAKPAGFARLFQKNGVAMSILLIICITLLLLLIQRTKTGAGEGFYALMSHTAMVTLFTPLFIAPLVLVGFAVRQYWRAVGGEKVRFSDVSQAMHSATTMKNLSGGQGQGCNFEAGTRFSNKRRWLHQATVAGFLLCFASTASATLMHYLFDLQAPYPFLSVPKLLGVPGGILLVIGTVGLAWLKTKSDPELGASGMWGGEMAFVLLLGATGATGLALYFATATPLVPLLLAVHLGCVMTLFVLLPYSKMVHGFFRMAALIRDAQQKAKF